MEELHKIFADFQQKVVEKENSLRRVGDSDMDLFFFKSDYTLFLGVLQACRLTRGKVSSYLSPFPSFSKQDSVVLSTLMFVSF